jgi:hypothetical protein
MSVSSQQSSEHLDRHTSGSFAISPSTFGAVVLALRKRPPTLFVLRGSSTLPSRGWSSVTEVGREPRSYTSLMRIVDSDLTQATAGHTDVPRRIFDESPNSWRDLQVKVAQTFAEIGCGVEIGKTKKLARGKAELDVVVHDSTTAPPSLYICECKHWARRVPKSVVHSFRTVVSELGANRGLLISRKKFQSGAIEAAEFTNIDLLDWGEFESIMFDRWLAGIAGKLKQVFEPVATLFDVNNDELYDQLERVGRDVEDWHRMIERYPLVTIWTLFVQKSAAGFGRIASLGIEVQANGRTERLDTHRKVVDYAPDICAAAIRELIPFWRIGAKDAATPAGD